MVGAVNVKKVDDAVKRVIEKEERGQNVIDGVPERSTERLETRVGNIMEIVGQKPRIVECRRLGRRRKDLYDQ